MGTGALRGSTDQSRLGHLTGLAEHRCGFENQVGNIQPPARCEYLWRAHNRRFNQATEEEGSKRAELAAVYALNTPRRGQ